jgi:uncharacterized protein YciU (UPF0263 family)
MRLTRCYKRGEKVSFKWYDNWRDEYIEPSNFRIISGIVDDDNDMDNIFSSIIINNHDEGKLYAVPRNNIL